MDVVNILGQSVGLTVVYATINVPMHEDNAGALMLAKTLPPHFTTRSKHYATKKIWFRAETFKVSLLT